MPRIVSLVPSVTETLVSLGVPPVGATRFCKQDALPLVGGTKNPDIEAIERLSPHLVVVNDEENRIEDVEALEAAGIPTVSVSPRSVDDVGPAVAAIAEMAEVEAPAGFDAASWSTWLEQWRRPTTPATVFAPVWARPWMTLNGATYGSSLLRLLGLENLYADADVRYPEVEMADVRTRNPEVVLLPTEPYPFQERHVVKVREAFPEATVSLVDGEDLFWWGARTPHAIRRLAVLFERLLPGLAEGNGVPGGRPDEAGGDESAGADRELEEPGLP